jgi:hypothetical protein
VFSPSLGALYFSGSIGPHDAVPIPLIAISKLMNTEFDFLSSKVCFASVSCFVEYGKTLKENGFFAEIDKLILKFMYKCERSKIGKNNLKKSNITEEFKSNFLISKLTISLQ